MADEDYRRALEKATREYEVLLAERTRVDERLAQLAQTIGNLMRLCHLTPTVSLGLTDACRMVLLAGAGQPLTALEVRQMLEAMGFDVARYANDLASIHTILKRLNQSGQADLVPRAHGKPAYRWRKRSSVVVLSKAEAAMLLGGSVDVTPRKRKH
jgi:hypothetical protein